MKQKRRDLHTSCELPNSKRVHKKIYEHIKQIIRQNHSVLSQQMNKKPEKIPQKIIQKTKQTHKYLYKKTLINTKFQWLNKYLQSSELQSLPVKINQKQQKDYSTDQNNNLYIFKGKSFNKQNQQGSHESKRNKRSKTQAHQEIERNQQVQGENYRAKSIMSKRINRNNDQELLQEVNLNDSKISKKNFQLKKSKSTKDRKNVLVIENDPYLKQMLLRQGKNMSTYLKSPSNTQDKENMKILGQRNLNNLHRFKEEDTTPARQFLQCTARLNSSNLMKNYASGQIKTKKRQYIYQSRQQRQQSQLLKIKRRFQQQITVQPWNLNPNDKDQETDFIMKTKQ